jgi:hypothetical protein
MGNEKWMAVHFVLLTLVLGSYIWLFFVNSYTAYKIYSLINTFVYLLMAFIMDQCNDPQYTVWANRKFVGRNKEEVEQYILNDRESFDCDRHEDMLNASSEED